MAVWTEQELQRELDRAVSSGWIPFFKSAATKYNFPLELLLAIASRETNMRNIKGDFQNGVYHGFGIMQVDIGTEPEFCNSWNETVVEGSIDCGTNILRGKRDFLTTKQITDLKAIAAAYNTGEGRVYRAILAGQDPDRSTTGGDYGKDVVARMGVFIRLLGNSASGAAG